jgi:23S rRNA (cytosine1962-C5)-methyltransferase
LPETWTICHDELQFQLKPTPFGNVGVYPEQAENWDWIRSQVKRSERRLKVLNLFAYTGGATLAAAAAGAEVVHVDAAANVVAWARRNAEASGLEDAPIRWIVEDAVKFCRREVRRGNRYDAVILDPPSYGHGPKGEVWKTERHLMSLLSLCGKLTVKRRVFVLVTCHTPSLGAAELEACLADAVFGHCQSGVRAYRLEIRSADGRTLPSGVMARWPG